MENTEKNLDTSLQENVTQAVNEDMQETADITGMFETNNDEIDLASIPKPEDGKEDDENNERPDIHSIHDVDEILNMIMEPDPENKDYSNTLILAMIQKLHNIREDATLDDIPEEDREYVDDIEVGDCKVDIFSLEGSMVNVVLTFDSIHSAYLKELNELLNRYRHVQEDLAVKQVADTAAMFTLTFMPKKMRGYASCTMNFPLMYARVLDDNDVNCAFQLMFDINNVKFALLDIDEETEAQLTADVMREAEESNGGFIFDVD